MVQNKAPNEGHKLLRVLSHLIENRKVAGKSGLKKKHPLVL
jgi:hypothetical protein